MNAAEVEQTVSDLVEPLGAPSGLLDEAYDMTLEVELLVSNQGLSWDEARTRV